jgi:beta-lactamase regulating signal transducer with metallopeptidase domain/uncharacterized protein involved in exopolysaccharide biosynthesis
MNVLAQVLGHPLAHRLGWALLHSIWEGAVVAALFGVFRLGLRRRSANARYLAACAMLVVLIGAPVITLLRAPTPALSTFTGEAGGGQLLAHEASTAFLGALHPFAKGDPPPQSSRHGTEIIDRVLPRLVQFWALGVIGLSCRWLHGSRWIRHLRTIDNEPLDPVWLLRLHDLCERLNITRPVRLLKSALVEVPMVVGWLRPVILLPASALMGLSREQLEAILAHELAHVRRYDYIVNTFQNLVETLMFYHPAVWWISRCIREEREHCCDDLVLSVCRDRMTYVRALVTLEEARGLPRLVFAASGGSLLHRVRRLLGVADEDRPPGAAEFGGIALVATGCVFILTALWLFNCPFVYQAAALIRVNPRTAPQTAVTDSGGSAGTYYPYLLQTECLVMQSPAVLNDVIQSLKLTEAWEQRQKPGEKPANGEVLKHLKAQLSLRPVPSTSVIEIQASDSEASAAARIANAVAASYKLYRVEHHRNAIRGTMDVLEQSVRSQEDKLRKAEDETERLRVELKVPDAFVSEITPTVLMSAESLRHIEGLRIEGEAEYVKQKTLLEQLEALDPKDLAETIPAIGVQDSQLSEDMQALAIVDQRLVGLKQELGPEHTEVLKTTAQQSDLRKKISDRTAGIITGLRAKLAATGNGLVALSNAVSQALDSDVAHANRSRRYFEAKRNLDELVQFRSVLQSKLALESTELDPAGEMVEVVEEAVAPALPMAPNRSRAIALLVGGLLLAATGAILARAGRHSMGLAMAC